MTRRPVTSDRDRIAKAFCQVYEDLRIPFEEVHPDHLEGAYEVADKLIALGLTPDPVAVERDWEGVVLCLEEKLEDWRETARIQVKVFADHCENHRAEVQELKDKLARLKDRYDDVRDWCLPVGDPVYADSLQRVMDHIGGAFSD